MENNNYTTDQLLEMAERYFNASLSDSEEATLKRAVAASADPRLNEIKAVLGFSAYGRHINVSTKKQVSRHNIVWRLSAAACITALLTTSAIAYMRSGSYSIAYIAGEKTTNDTEVMQQMLSAMQSVDINQSDRAVDNELQNVFSTIN